MLDRSLKITEHQWNKEDNALLYVQVLTYNHESYIKECIEGILMQETTFPIHIVVFEDCSTDKTAEILKEYKTKHPKLFTLYLQPVNTYGKDIRQKALQPWYETAKKGKYIAKCEGDDYWTDPLKLQKQVDFLEENEEYGLVHTNYACVDGDNNSIDKFNRSWPSGDVFNLIMKGKYNIVTASTLFRMNLHEEVKQELSMMRFKMGDLPLWLSLSRVSKVKYLDDNTTNYRILKESASHSTDLSKVYNFNFEGFLIRKHFADKFNITFNEKKFLIKLNREMVKQAYLKSDYEATKLYYNKSKKGNLLTVFNPKTTLFFLGVRFTFFDKIIKLLYKI